MRVWRARLAFLVAISAAVSLGSIGAVLPASGEVAPSDPCALTAILENPCRPLLGAESNGYLPGATFPERMKEHEERIGRAMDLVHIYVTDKPTMTTYEKQVASTPGRIALVNWKVSTDWGNAADGTLDDKIDVMADSIASIPQKVMLTVAHEPEDNLSPTGADQTCPTSQKTDSRGTPADYVAMWHHVRERFDAKGVGNVVWVMNYMGYSKYFGCAERLWPGNAYVDWVMWDPYPTGSSSYEKTVGGFYSYLTEHSDAEHDYLSKPWGLAEWGYIGTSQPAAYAMYADAKNALHTNLFPKLKAYLIWDNVGAGDERVGYDSLGNPDPQEQAAYNSFANDPTFSPDTTPPTTVTGLAADTVTATGAHLTWTAATDAVRTAGYRIYRDDALVATLPASETGYTDTSLTEAHSYRYEVTALDPSGNESAPTEHVVTTPDVTAPTAPGSLTTTPGKRQVTLSWVASTDNVSVTGYRVLRDGSFWTTTTGTTLTDTGLGELVSYAYSVVALDGAGNASAATSQVARTLDSTAPRAPSGLTATLSGTAVRLAWTKPSDNVGVTSYAVYRGTTLIGSPTTPAFRDSTPRQGSRVSYTVYALDAARNTSPASTTATATIPDRTAPTNPPLTATAGSKKITLTWKAATDNVAVTRYWLYRGTTRIAVLASTARSYVNTGLKTGSSYSYRLAALDAAGNQSSGSRVSTKAR
jgi:fibronectin type 3 domain-containing protein